MHPVRAELELLLHSRKLDVTLTTAAPWRQADGDRLAASGWPLLDDALSGGLRRGHLSEVVGPRSSGRSTVFCQIAAAATARGEAVALIDTHDRFDPGSAEAAGVDLGRLLWVRETGDHARALKAFNLVLQAGGFGVVAFDLSDVRRLPLQQFPPTTWMRISRVIEGSSTVALLVGAEHVARSAGGATIALDAAAAGVGQWRGTSVRARRLQGIAVHPRVISARSGLAPVPAAAAQPGSASAAAGAACLRAV
jgi:recombination protein RecA